MRRPARSAERPVARRSLTRPNRRIARAELAGAARAAAAAGPGVVTRVVSWVRRLVKPIAILALLGGLVYGGLTAHRFVLQSPHFQVRRIDVSPTVHVTAEEIRHLAGIGPKTNVFAVDLRQVAARVRRHPWIASATAHRRLPNAIRLVVREEEAVAAVLIEGHEKGDSHLYLVNADGRPFKRALPAELEGLPVVTGVTRADYRRQKAQVVARVREALHAYRTYVSQPGRPRLGELHWDPVEGLTLYTAERGTQVRLGRGPVGPKLRRLDRVLGALAERGQRATVVRLDNARQPERVVVRLAEAEAPR